MEKTKVEFKVEDLALNLLLDKSVLACIDKDTDFSFVFPGNVEEKDATKTYALCGAPNLSCPHRQRGEHGVKITIEGKVEEYFPCKIGWRKNQPY